MGSLPIVDHVEKIIKFLEEAFEIIFLRTMNHELVATLQAFTMNAGSRAGLGHGAHILGGHVKRNIEINQNIELILPDL